MKGEVLWDIQINLALNAAKKEKTTILHGLAQNIAIIAVFIYVQIAGTEKNSAQNAINIH